MTFVLSIKYTHGDYLEGGDWGTMHCLKHPFILITKMNVPCRNASVVEAEWLAEVAPSLHSRLSAAR